MYSDTYLSGRLPRTTTLAPVRGEATPGVGGVPGSLPDAKGREDAVEHSVPEFEPEQVGRCDQGISQIDERRFERQARQRDHGRVQRTCDVLEAFDLAQGRSDLPLVVVTGHSHDFHAEPREQRRQSLARRRGDGDRVDLHERGRVAGKIALGSYA